MALSTRWGSLSTKVDGYVGFDTLQDQIRKKNLKKGFELNLMVVGTLEGSAQDFRDVTTKHPSLPGESGLGKSTLVNTLFKSRISRQTCTPGPHEVPRTIEVNSVSHGKRTEGVANWNLGMCCECLGVLLVVRPLSIFTPIGCEAIIYIYSLFSD